MRQVDAILATPGLDAALIGPCDLSASMNLAGQLARAALDVFEHEPYQPVHPGKDLRALPNVVLTPHIGSNTREANARMAGAAVDNVRHFLAREWELLACADRP